MAKKRGDDDGYGYDPERGMARTLFENMEHRQAERPAQQIGEVLKLPKITPTQKRLLRAHAAILDGTVKVIDFQHTVFCQVGLPYRPTTVRPGSAAQAGVPG